MATVVESIVQGEERYLLYNIPWKAYVDFGDSVGERPVPRMTYDRGTLEFMTPLPIHEIGKCCLHRLIETMAEECGMNLKPGGQMTFRRQDLEAGFELDECYWIEHEPLVRGKLEYDPHIDPPPDLGVEIEISRSAINRMRLFAAMRIGEIWRFNGQTLTVEVLQSDGKYERCERSPRFPWAPPEEIATFIIPREPIGYLENIRAFRRWIAERRAQEAEE